MTQEPNHEIFYPTKEQVMGIHSDILEEDEDASSGLINEGSIDFALECIEHGHFGKQPETVHEKAIELLRLLSANHPFADGNKRTALNTTWTFYAMNGYYFDYSEEIKAILKLFAVMERMVDVDEVTEYFSEITYSEDDERVPSTLVKLIHLQRWDQHLASRFQDVDRKVNQEGKDFEDIDEDLFELLMEFSDLVSEFLELREESGMELPDQVLDHIEDLEKEAAEISRAAYELLEERLDGDVDEYLERIEENMDDDAEDT